MYKDINGKEYRLDKKIGAGGDGTVYSIQDSQDLVAKIFRESRMADTTRRSTLERKIKAMIKMNIETRMGGILRIAWPLECLYSDDGFCGYILPKVINGRSLNMLQFEVAYILLQVGTSRPNVRDLMKIYPNYTWKYSFQFAYNLAWVVNYIHSYDVIIGDLNPNNILIDIDTGAAVLIDCDTYDITDQETGERFPCEVGMPEMLAPELQAVGSLVNGKFSKESDDFSLALNIFRLLMNNADPFNGVPSQGVSTNCIISSANIINGNCPYVKKCNISIPFWAFGLDVLPLGVKELFKKTFDYNATNALEKKKDRATAEEWCYVLAPLGAKEPNREWVTCVANKQHVYPVHNESCPWCAKRNGGRVDNEMDYPEYHKDAQDWMRTSIVYAPPKLSDSEKNETGVLNKKNIWEKIKGIWDK